VEVIIVEVAKVTSKGQITIPISIRRRLEINEGDKVLFIYKPEGVMMVNPNSMQSGYPVDIVEASEAELEVAAAAAINESEPVKKAPREDYQKPASPPPSAFEPEKPVRRPVPPPVEEPQKEEKHVGGFNLSTLLDDIRSIGSNI